MPMDTPPHEFGRRIRARRLQLMVAGGPRRASGLHRTSIGSVERGERNISLLNVVRVAGVVGAGLQDPQDEPMKCVVCHSGDTRSGTTSVTFHQGGQTVVVNAVPAEVCENCGEAYAAEDVTEQLLEIAEDARKANTHVLVRDYAPAA